MIATIEKIKNIELGRGYQLTEIDNDDGLLRGEFRVKNSELSYDDPFGIHTLFEDEIGKINSISEIEEVEISNVFTEHYDNNDYSYIVKFLIYLEG